MIPIQRTLVILSLIPGPAALAAELPKAPIHIQVAQSSHQHYSLYDPMIHLNLSVSFEANHAAIAGDALSGEMTRKGTAWMMAGSNASVQISENPGKTIVDAVVPDDVAKNETSRISFAVYRAPGASFIAWGAGSRAQIQPQADGRYEISGRVDPKKFTPKAAAILAVTCVVAIREMGGSQAAIAAPLLRLQPASIHPLPNMPAK